jgi:hypothetical protein
MDQHTSFLHSSICTEFFLVIVNISMLKKDTGDNLNIEERIICFPNIWCISIFFAFFFIIWNRDQDRIILLSTLIFLKDRNFIEPKVK